MKAIDLYAGVGGWSVGFKLAGVDVVQSYEWWEPAAKTHRANCGSEVVVVDIRNLELGNLPKNIDVVVGSPPCTQFSYSNRGGSGDLADGLIDIKKFLAIVRHLEPTLWAFENVPRVKLVLERELQEGGALEEFRSLFDDAQIEVFDMQHYGVPQRRKRCIAGNFDFALLNSYSAVSSSPTLGMVIDSLSKNRDPIFRTPEGFVVTDNQPEEALNWEEERFNREMKTAHPIYNDMPFPDPLDRPSRTVTATCTRVSRESLVVEEPETSKYRRLSVRERASLQSFPAGIQFLGKSHSEKLKMVGNAIPPVFTYLIAEAMKGVRPSELIRPDEIDANIHFTKVTPVPTSPDTSGRTYPGTRRFRFSIPNLRFKSGTRFELSNIDGPNSWSVAFFFGDSKRIHRKDFSFNSVMDAAAGISDEFNEKVAMEIKGLNAQFSTFHLSSLQSTWAHQSDELHPFELIDNLGFAAKSMEEKLLCSGLEDGDVERFIHALIYNNGTPHGLAERKISRYLYPIMAGILLAAVVNQLMYSTSKGVEADMALLED